MAIIKIGICEICVACFILGALYCCHCAPLAADCDRINALDCNATYKPEGNETVCGSDLNVYPNLCFFAKAKCKDTALNILYTGGCIYTTPIPGNTTTTTGTVAPVFPVGGNVSDPDFIIHEQFCTYKDQINCPDTLDPICGSDHKFYQNDCEFAKAMCNNTSLLVENDLDLCKNNTNRRSMHLEAATSNVRRSAQAAVPVGSQGYRGLGISANAVRVHQDSFGEERRRRDTHTGSIFREQWCSNIDQVTCSDELRLVCGTNRKFYRNQCEFAKAECQDRTLRIQTDLSVCTTRRSSNAFELA
ncbi:agrin-like [Mya arenaria]|uniref:agrin-like n=1 Tax=Mya arenaria TaxID=6604 RepID=UPI0022E5C591|nr:agrin-like [Mya arenaria]